MAVNARLEALSQVDDRLGRRLAFVGEIRSLVEGTKTYRWRTKIPGPRSLPLCRRLFAGDDCVDRRYLRLDMPPMISSPSRLYSRIQRQRSHPTDGAIGVFVCAVSICCGLRLHRSLIVFIDQIATSSHG